jgi:hypothetical protein
VLSQASSLQYTQTSPYRARETLPGFVFAQRRALLCPTSPNARAAVQAVPGYHRDAHSYHSCTCTITDGRSVLSFHRRYKEQNPTCSHVPATPTRTNAVTGHEMLAYLQLPCICSYVPEILFSMNTSNINLTFNLFYMNIPVRRRRLSGIPGSKSPAEWEA